MSKTLLLGLIFVFGCAPKVYVIDRHTILEEEAAGEWPDLEEAFLSGLIKRGPTFYKKQHSSQRKRRVWKVLNGELSKNASEVQ